MLRVNNPPEQAMRVDHRRLHDFVSTAARTVGLTGERAQLLADLLVANDLRGVFSHGSHQIAAYARLIRDRDLNSDPDLKIVRETPNSLLLDGWRIHGQIEVHAYADARSPRGYSLSCVREVIK